MIDGIMGHAVNKYARQLRDDIMFMLGFTQYVYLCVVECIVTVFDIVY
jgi:hypothetical protein